MNTMNDYYDDDDYDDDVIDGVWAVWGNHPFGFPTLSPNQFNFASRDGIPNSSDIIYLHPYPFTIIVAMEQ